MKQKSYVVKLIPLALLEGSPDLAWTCIRRMGELGLTGEEAANLIICAVNRWNGERDADQNGIAPLVAPRRLGELACRALETEREIQRAKDVQDS